MQVKVTTAFNDQTVDEEADRRREIGHTFDATAERAGYLEALGYVEKIDQSVPVETIQPSTISEEAAPLPLVSPVDDAPASLATPATADFHVAQD